MQLVKPGNGCKLLQCDKGFTRLCSRMAHLRCSGTTFCCSTVPCSSGLPDAEEPVPDAMPAGMTATASNAGLELACDLLLQGCRLSSTQWQPGNVLMCAAWTLKVVCLPKQPDAVQHSLQQIDEANLDLALHGLQRCVCQAPPAPALWPDTFLWWYLLIAAKVWHHELCRPLVMQQCLSHRAACTCLSAASLLTPHSPLKMCSS